MIALLFSLVYIFLLLSPKPAYATEVPPPSQKAVATREELPKRDTTILDTYDIIKDFYAYDPETKKWAQIKNFKIVKKHIATKNKPNSTLDLTLYANFWAHDAHQKKWHQVSLLSYLSPNEKKNPLSTKHSTALSNVPKQTLLNELLSSYKPKQSNVSHTILSNFSFHTSLGTGLSFYRNELKKLTLYAKRNKSNKYYFVTDNRETYRPNWFKGVLTHLTNVDPGQKHAFVKGSNNALFQGKGWAFPIAFVLKYTFVERLFFAFGREFLLKHLSELSHNDHKIRNKVLKFNQKKSAEGRWLWQGGWYFFHSAKHKFFGDFSFFYVHHMGDKFHAAIFAGDYIHKAYAFNPGIGYEKQLTDYLSWTTRFSVEWQQFKEFQTQAYNIMYRIPAIYLELGLAIKLAQKGTKQ